MVRAITTLMGQFRFPGSGMVNNIDCNYKYTDVKVNIDDNEGSDSSFKDVRIIPTSPLQKNHDYYLKLQIPQDTSYDMTFNIQLSTAENATSLTYQFIRQIYVSLGGNAGDSNVHLIVLYEDTKGNMRIVVDPPEYSPTAVGKTDQIYVVYSMSESSSKVKIPAYYRIYDGNDFIPWDKFNDFYATASWKETAGVTYAVFEMIFRPIEDGFEYIDLKMHRTPEDYNIQRNISDPSSENILIEYGRKLKISNTDDKDGCVQCELLSVTNLIDSQYIATNDQPLSRIGVWSHPGLMMAINGEEISITANGYYELDVLPITTLGVVARNSTDKILGSEEPYGYRDFFTIDYEYEDET